MSRRSRLSRSPITLFFFQDIIMSTSGILIVIVLVLSLELLDRTTLSQSTDSRPDVDLKQKVEDLAIEVTALEQRLSSATKLIETASSMSHFEREEQIRQIQTANQIHLAELNQLQATWAALEGKQPERDSSLQTVEQLRSRLEAAQKKRDSLTGVLDQERTNDRPVFVFEHGEQHEGWIVDLAGDRVQVAPIGRVSKPTSFVGTMTSFFGSKSAIEQFQEWVVAQNEASSGYYFLFVRPSGVEAFDDVAKALKNSRIPYGYDLIGDRDKLLDPVRGAGQ